MNSDDPEPKPARLVPAFTPAPVRFRHDGWHPERQIAFVEALADTGCVETAARHVGMSVQSAYALRRRHQAKPFREAWDAALDMAMQRLEQAALARALGGVPRPIFYKGEQVGEWRHHDERLTMFLLRYRRGVRFGAWHDRMPPQLREADDPGEPLEPPEDDSALRLAGQLDCIELIDWPEDSDGGGAADGEPSS